MHSSFILFGIICMLPAVLGNTTTMKTTTSTSSSAKSTSTSCKYVEYTDTFDNYTNLVAPETATIGFDGGLYYYFNPTTQTNNSVLYIIPQSQPVIAAIGTVTDLTAFGDVTTLPFGVITTNMTATKSFNLIQFYYACSQNTNGAALVPIGCALEVYGYDTSGMRTESVALTYAPRSQLTAQPMSRAILPLSFQLTALRNVTIAVATSSAVGTATVLYIDSVTHENCQ